MDNLVKMGSVCTKWTVFLEDKLRMSLITVGCE